jgi:hypothetical protein
MKVAHWNRLSCPAAQMYTAWLPGAPISWTKRYPLELCHKAAHTLDLGFKGQDSTEESRVGIPMI